MVKEKRKNRLDKGTSEFMGFGAFESVSTAAAVPQSEPITSANTLAWAPVYTGSDTDVHLVFGRLHKRDAVTKVKALGELSIYFQSDQPRRLQAPAVEHWAWLYAHKLAYDTDPGVRAAAQGVWKAAAERLPKVTTGLVTEYRDILGMLASGLVDPASDVRQQASAAAWAVSQPDWPWADGVVEYASRILGYGRMSVMYQALFARKNKETSLTDVQKDAEEERFERLVATALGVLEYWMRQQGPLSVTDPTVFWKTLTSSKPRLRRLTYHLLATTATKQLSLLPEDVSARMVQAVSSEKEASNLPTLLETILTLSSQQCVDLAMLEKPLCKVLRKACYGARVDQWGPMMLPLTAVYERPLSLLRALLEGADLTFGESERAKVLGAVTESTAFCLLRKREDTKRAEDTQSVSQLWLDVWSHALTMHNPKQPTVVPAHVVQLLEEVAKSLNQLELATRQDRRNCDFYAVHDWFWSALTLKDVRLLNVTAFLQPLLEAPMQDDSSPILPPMRDYFTANLALYQAASSSVPSTDAYELYQAMFAYCGPSQLLPNGALERFVMSDLLRWIVIHTSSVSPQAQSRTWVEYDFGLLATALASLIEKRASLWEAILKELVKTKCHIEWWLVGAEILLSRATAGPNPSEWFCSSTLDEYAKAMRRSEDDSILVATRKQNEGSLTTEQSVAVTASEADVQPHDDGLFHFFRLLVGATERSTVLLVSRDLLSEWIALECSNVSHDELPDAEEKSSSLLQALLELVKTNAAVLSQDEIEVILLSSWLRSGRFDSVSSSLLGGDESLYERFIAKASRLLQNQLSALCTKSKIDAASAAECGSLWSNRAWRLFQACRSREKTHQWVRPSFSLIGLGSFELWKSYPSFLYWCTKSLFDHFETAPGRLSLLEGPEDSGDALVVAILLSISEASSDPCKAARAKTWQDRAACFLRSICGDELSTDLVQRWMELVIIRLKESFQMTGDDYVKYTAACVAVLSQLIETAFSPVAPEKQLEMNASEIKEGAMLWYITDPQKAHERELVQVVKVHFDAQAGYYFTVRLERDVESQERQTVAERLRSEKVDKADGVLFSSLSNDEQSRRGNLRDVLVVELIKPSLATHSWKSLLPELVSVLSCNVGLGSEKGIGSARFELLNLLRLELEHAAEALDRDESSVATDKLWTLSLSFGYGLATKSAPWLFQYFPVDIMRSLRALLGYYSRCDVGTLQTLDSAALAWLTTSFAGAADTKLEDGCLRESLSLCFNLSSKLFDNKQGSGFSGDDMIATRAIYQSMAALSPARFFDEALLRDAKRACARLISVFAADWEDGVAVDPYGGVGSTWFSDSNFGALIELCRSTGSGHTLSTAAHDGRICESLSIPLFSPTKRHFAFVLLDSVAASGDPLFDEAPLGTGTTKRLHGWIKGLGEEEADEITEDVEVVSRWLPGRMMATLEAWGEAIYEETDDSVTIGRLLTWLCILRFVDSSASPNDFRFRPAFLSYLSKCGAADAALNVALLNDEAINDNKGKTPPALLDVEALLDDTSLVTVPSLASLVLFRTIEILPSLSRQWWEESCPKVYVSDVQAFVEKHVAPEILRRELGRIRDDNTSEFGDMTVRASSVSREVEATYVQDDFTLSVWIMLPPAFPFRSAQVDCSKTLGVPSDRWKRWALQITMMLNNQGGTLQDALMLWKDNVDKEFEGVEPCPVCYSVLHVKTHKLPKLVCKTCHNRFHVDCLTQWFRSSGKSQCVLCQQPWQGTRV